jgi:hypothetical protein
VKDLEKKILAMENSTKEKGDLIKALEVKIEIQEKKIEEMIQNLSTLMEKETSLIEKYSKHFNDDKINKMERRIFVQEKRRLGSDFCDFCDLELNLGSEKDRKEKLNLKTKKT